MAVTKALVSRNTNVFRLLEISIPRTVNISVGWMVGRFWGLHFKMGLISTAIALHRLLRRMTLISAVPIPTPIEPLTHQVRELAVYEVRRLRNRENQQMLFNPLLY